MPSRAAVALILSLVIGGGGASAAPVAIEPFGDADAEMIAASGTGNASTCHLAFHCVALSGMGQADGVNTWSGAGNATSCTRYAYCVAGSGLGNATGYWAVSGAGNATGCTYNYAGLPCAAVSATGNASSPNGVAVSGFGRAEGRHALSGAALLGAFGGRVPVVLP